MKLKLRISCIESQLYCRNLKPVGNYCWKIQSAHPWSRSAVDSQIPDPNSGGVRGCVLDSGLCAGSRRCSRLLDNESSPSCELLRCDGSNGSWPCTDCCSIGIDISWYLSGSSYGGLTRTAWNTCKVRVKNGQIIGQSQGKGFGFE